MEINEKRKDARFCDIPKDDLVVLIDGNQWTSDYGFDEKKMHFHKILEIGICDFENEPSRGCIRIVPENSPHRLPDNYEDAKWTYLYIRIDRILGGMYGRDTYQIKEIQNKIGQRIYCFHQEKRPALTSIIRQIEEELRTKNDMYSSAILGLASYLIVMLARERSESFEDGELNQTGSYAQVLPAVEYIHDHYSEPIKIADVAAACHLSESHFRRLFEQCTDMTPVEYLNKVRVRRACELILAGRHSMEEIALRVGYATVSTFNRNFKLYIGTSPGQWKRMP